ncbi:cytosine-purine permease [Suillus variegatus]|nr:cytosine-purine permease [Suillus variegatus]
MEDSRHHIGFLKCTTQLLSRYGIETHGIAPVPAEERLETRWYQLFFVWFSSSMNILAAVFGPKLGMRTMIQARFSWGLFGAIVPPVFNVFSSEGFLVLNCIIGEQTLASLSSRLDDTLGLAILGIISLGNSDRMATHRYESVAWIPNVISFIAMLAIGYPQLRENLSAPVPPATPANIMSFASFLASNIIGWCPIITDYGVYYSPDASFAKIFVYAYLGFFISNVIDQALGAAFAAAAPKRFDNSSSVGGLLHSVLLRTGAFEKILTALVALSISGACAPSIYTFSNSFMAIIMWFAAVPRWVYILVLLPVAIVGAKRCYATFVNILIQVPNIVFSAIILAEQMLFRRASYSEVQYPIATWASYALLPSGIPAVVAFVCACGALVPFMSQAWYVGPVAR